MARMAERPPINAPDPAPRRPQGPLTRAGEPAAPAADASRLARGSAGPDPILVSARTAARLLDIGLRTWWRLHASESCPAPTVHIGRAVRWDFDELRRWGAAGCPRREAWEGQRSGRPVRNPVGAAENAV